MASTPLLVTGASGQLGRRVLELLLERNAGPIIATTRTPASLAGFAARGVDVRRADFEDDASLTAAFAGAKRALLISTDAVDRPGRRLAQHRSAIAAFERAGIEHVVYTSLPNPIDTPVTIAPDHAGTEAALAASKLGVTGPEAVTADQLAAIASELTGRPVVHTSVPVPALIEGMVGHGLPRPFAELLASFDAATAKGDYHHVTATVEQLSGTKPTSVAAFLRVNRAALLPAA
jgi:NAD(P)H dehydrogenase (quinone)